MTNVVIEKEVDERVNASIEGDSVGGETLDERKRGRVDGEKGERKRAGEKERISNEINLELLSSRTLPLLSTGINVSP